MAFLGYLGEEFLARLGRNGGGFFCRLGFLFVHICCKAPRADAKPAAATAGAATDAGSPDHPLAKKGNSRPLLKALWRSLCDTAETGRSYLSSDFCMAVNLDTFSHQQLIKLIQKARERQEAARRESIDKLREKIRSLIAAEELAFEDVFPTKGQHIPTKSIVAAKYRNPSDALQTWSGRGKRPLWLNAALKAGKKLEELAV